MLNPPIAGLAAQKPGTIAGFVPETLAQIQTKSWIAMIPIGGYLIYNDHHLWGGAVLAGSMASFAYNVFSSLR